MSEQEPAGTDATKGADSRPPVAIVGIGCRFPGGVTDAGSYWSFLTHGGDGLVEIPPSRWDVDKFYDPDLGPGKSRVRRGGFLTSPIDEFDAGFFGISPREAEHIDPQQRMLLEVSYEAIEDAGLPLEQLAGTPVGVFVGGFTLDYGQLQFAGGQRSRSLLQAHTATGVVMTLLANRISHAYDLVGPSMSVDTACSSSLVAVHLACRSIWAHESAAALAGGVNLMLSPNFTIAASQGGFLSPTSQSRAFHAQADGYVRAEGCGVVVLRPLADAVADGNRVYAVILGTAVSQDGHTNGITVPNGASQALAMRDALRGAAVDPATVGYVEAHGTGTPVGDPIEVNAIGGVYGAGRRDSQRCLVGSVKTNIGHTEAAAGVAGLIKAALVLEHRQVPQHLHLTELNPKIDLPGLGLSVPQELTALPVPGNVARAAVNSFGFGGTNAHVVLEQAPAAVPAPPTAPTELDAAGIVPVFPLSARSHGALTGLAESYLSSIHHGADLEGLGAAATRRRSAHTQVRLAVVARDTASLADCLDACAQGVSHPDLLTSQGPANAGPLAMLFTGMGPQWWGMGRGLLDHNGVYREGIERCDAALAPLTGWSLVDELHKDAETSRMSETRVSQIANFAVQVALCDLWRHLGIEPAAILGHSAGEVAAAYVAGALSFEDAVTVVFHRARLQHLTSGQGRLLALSLSAREAGAFELVRAGRLHVAAVNSPSSVALVGVQSDLEEVQALVEESGTFARLVEGNVPFHSPWMDPLEDELRECLADLRPLAPTVAMYSTVTGRRVEGALHDADYWWRNVRQPVLLADAAAAMIDDGYLSFLEIGPNPVLGHAVSDCLREAGRSGLTVGSLKRKEADAEMMAASCAKLYVAGHALRWTAFYPHDGGQPLPPYPWQHERYWMESEQTRIDRQGELVHPLLGARRDSAAHVWVRDLDESRPAYLADHLVHKANLFPGAGYVDMALAAAKDYGPAGRYSVADVAFLAPVVIRRGVVTELETTLDRWTGAVRIAGRVSPDSGWVAHASAVVMPARGVRARYDIGGARERCSTRSDHDECYASFRDGGFEYGPEFRVIDTLWTGDDEAVGRFRTNLLTGASRDARGDVVLDPLVLDGCFQMLLPLAPLRGIDLTTVMPVGVKRIEASPLLDERLADSWIWAHSRVSDVRDDSFAGDIVATDEFGHVLLEVSGFRVQLMREATQTHRQGNHWLYTAGWEPRSLEPVDELPTDPVTAQPLPAESAGAPVSDAAVPPAAADEGPHTWLLLADDDGFADRLSELLRARHDRALLVRRGAATHDDELEVADGSRASIDTGLTWAQTQAPDGVHGVLDLRGCRLPSEETSDYVSLAMTTPVGLLDLVQALDAANLAWPLTVVTCGAQAVTGSVPASGLGQAPLWGMVRVLHQESTELDPRLIDLDPTRPFEDLPALVDEVTSETTDEDQVAFRDGARQVARLEPASEPETWLPAALKPFATYLITGGLGALGLVFARWLARRGARRIVLVGRRGLPPRSEWATLQDQAQRRLVEQVFDIERSGATVEVVALDITDRDAMTGFLADRRSRSLPPVRGVLHSAGVLHDQVMLSMSHQVLEDVLVPKVVGGWVLHEALADEPLDFFALFSSVSSVLVTPGQGNYAAANAFLDALASYRAGQAMPAVSINWGPWDVGMIAEMNLEAFYARRGLDLLPELTGVQLLSVILAKGSTQEVVVSADWETLVASYPVVPKMIEHLGRHETGSESAESSMAWSDRIDAADVADRPQLVADACADVIGSVLRIPPADLQRDVPLNQLGLDSMIAVEVRIRLEKTLGYAPKVVVLLQGVSVVEVAEIVHTEREAEMLATPEALAAMMGDLDEAAVEALLASLEAEPAQGGTA